MQGTHWTLIAFIFACAGIFAASTLNLVTSRDVGVVYFLQFTFAVLAGVALYLRSLLRKQVRVKRAWETLATLLEWREQCLVEVVRRAEAAHHANNLSSADLRRRGECVSLQTLSKEAEAAQHRYEELRTRLNTTGLLDIPEDYTRYVSSSELASSRPTGEESDVGAVSASA